MSPGAGLIAAPGVPGGSGAPGASPVSGSGIASWDPSRDRALFEALGEAASVLRPGRRVECVCREPVAEASSWALERIRLLLDDGDMPSLLFKDLGQPLDPASPVAGKPPEIVDDGREAWTLRTILEPAGRSAPRLVHRTDGIGDGPWLFLEWVDGTRLAEVGFGPAWDAAAEWIARLHVEGTEALAAAGPGGRAHLLPRTSELSRWWFRRAARFGDGRRIARLRSAHERALRILASHTPVTLHGEYYPANILVEAGSGRLRPVDWEMAGLGPGLLDLAALTTGLPDEWRLRLADIYRQELSAMGAEESAATSIRHGLPAARLVLAVQWLGWARSWNAPPEQQFAWLDEAERTATELES